MRCSPGGQLGQPAGLLLVACRPAGAAATPSSWTARISPVVAQARLSCSIARQSVRRSAPRPPYSRGTAGPGCPAAARSSLRSWGNSPVRSISAARGATRSSASVRTASRRSAAPRSAGRRGSARSHGHRAHATGPDRRPARVGAVRPSAAYCPGLSGRLATHEPGLRFPASVGMDICAGSGTTMDETTGRMMLDGGRRGRRSRHARDGAPAADQAAGPHESLYATSTEGMKRCLECDIGTVTDAICSDCGKLLRG